MPGTLNNWPNQKSIQIQIETPLGPLITLFYRVNFENIQCINRLFNEGKCVLQLHKLIQPFIAFLKSF